jgi:hypothetical protein
MILARPVPVYQDKKAPHFCGALPFIKQSVGRYADFSIASEYTLTL